MSHNEAIHDDDLKRQLGLYSRDRSDSAYTPVNGDAEALQHLLSRHYLLPPTPKDLVTASSKIHEFGFGAVIPMREHGRVIEPVLTVLTNQIASDSIVVVNDSSDDDALNCVREFQGVRLVYRDDVLNTLDWKRLYPILNVKERPVGKGMAVLAGYLVHYALRLSGVKHKWVFQNDSEITEYKRYQCLQHLTVGLVAYPTARAVKTAKFGRTNERTMCMRSALGLLAELPNVPSMVRNRATEIFERVVSDKWIQTGEFALRWDVAMARPFATGYIEESLCALFCADLFAKQDRGFILKVANPNPRLDGANDERKEAIMQQQVSNFWLSMAFFKKSLADWDLDDIKTLNHGIMAKNITMSWIPPDDGPCKAEVVRNDRIIPSITQLDEANLIDIEALVQLV